MSMTTQFIVSHLWESTLFGIACGLLILVLGKSWSFSRHLLAWAGLVKFIIPFTVVPNLFEKMRTLFAIRSQSSETVVPYIASLSQTLQIENWIALETSQPLGVETSTNWTWLLVSFWLLGFSAMFVFWIVQFTKVRSSTLTRCKDADERWQAIAKRIWEKSESSLPRIFICEDKCLVAGVFGFRRPIVIIPSSVSQDFTDLEREAFLRHEFQHIYKRDHLWIYLQKSIRNLIWFHPLAWWFDHQISAEREIMRDAEVIHITNNIPSYLNCLMKASNFNTPNNYANTVGIKGSAFSRRIKAIRRFRPTQLIDKLSAAGSITAIITLTIFLSSHFSVTELEAADTGSNTNPPPKSTTTSKDLRNEARNRQEAILEYYHDHRDQFRQEAQVRLKVIRLARSADGGHDLQSQQADAIMEALKQGETFDALVKKYGNDVMSQYGGDWGWINRSDLRNELAEIAFSLEIGGHSEPIQVGKDLFIIKVENRDGPRVKSLTEVREQILEILLEQAN